MLRIGAQIPSRLIVNARPAYARAGLRLLSTGAPPSGSNDGNGDASATRRPPKQNRKTIPGTTHKMQGRMNTTGKLLEKLGLFAESRPVSEEEKQEKREKRRLKRQRQKERKAAGPSQLLDVLNSIIRKSQSLQTETGSGKGAEGEKQNRGAPPKFVKRSAHIDDC